MHLFIIWIFAQRECNKTIFFHVNVQIQDRLFELDKKDGFDLVALNIQRGRDHGIPGYVEYRKICQTGPANSFDDLKSNISPEV